MTAPSTKEIADTLMRKAPEYPWYCDDSEMAEFRMGSVTIRCVANRHAIGRVAEKYRKGFKRGWHPPAYRRRATTKRSKFSVQVLSRFLFDQEPENARTYVDQFEYDTLTQKDLVAITSFRRTYNARTARAAGE